MGDAAEGFADLKFARQAERRRRLEIAATDFPAAKQTATEAGLILVRLSEFHFRLIADKWSVDLWPSTQRIVRLSGQFGFNRSLIGEIAFQDWTLISVVDQAKKLTT